MATELMSRTKCDRCKRVMAEESMKVGEALAKNLALISLETSAEIGAELAPIHWEDLCNACKKRVADLVAQILKAKGARDDGGEADEEDAA